MPQPGFLSTKLSIAIWYSWWNWHIESLRPSTEFTVGARKNQKKLSPIVSKENIQSISSIWSVNLLCFFQCASTNRNIMTLSSTWPVKSIRFFRLECPNRGSFWRNYVLPHGICGQNCIYTWIYCWLYVHVLSNNPLYWVYRWSPKNQKKKTIPIASKENIRLIIFYLIGKNTVFFSVYIHKSKYFDIIFYMTGKKHMFFSAGMPQPGFFLKKFWIVICYMWSKCHLDMYFFGYCIQQEPQKIRKTKSHSLEITYSVHYLLSDR